MKRHLGALGLMMFASSLAFAGSVCPAGSGGYPFAYNPDNANTGCNIIITINPNQTITVTTKDSNGYDFAPGNGAEDVMVGVVNNASVNVTSLTLNGTNIFGFDQDGICAFTFSGSSYCLTNGPGGTASTGVLTTNLNNKAGVDPYDYQGPTSSFPGWTSGGNHNSGTVAFNPAIPANGGTTYFSLEGLPNSTVTGTLTGSTPVPALSPQALVLLALLLAIAAYMLMRRKAAVN